MAVSVTENWSDKAATDRRGLNNHRKPNRSRGRVAGRAEVGEEYENRKLSRARNERKNRIGGIVAGPSESAAVKDEESP